MKVFNKHSLPAGFSSLFLRILSVFLLWRIGLFAVSFVADQFIVYAPSFPYAFSLLPSFHLPRWLYSFANFDGVHYLTIAKEGYLQTDFIQAFFPLYPFVLIRGVSLLFPFVNLLGIGLLLSNFSFFGFLLVSFDLIAKRYSRKTAWFFLAAILLSPWSVFLASVYTESLFLLLLVLCFWFADKKLWWAAGISAALLSATRIVGVFIVPALLIELFVSYISQTSVILDAKLPKKQHGSRGSRFFVHTFTQWSLVWSQLMRKKTLLSFIQKELKNIAFIVAGVTGLLAYMLYLQIHFGDPLHFFHVQSSFGAGRSTSLVVYPQVVWRGIKILFTSPFDVRFVTSLLEFLAGTFGLIAIVFASKKVSLGLTFFCIVSFLFPTLSGSFLSMGRFLLPCVSIYILIALQAEKSKLFRVLFFGVSGILLIVNTILFVQGYWVA